MDRQHHLQRVTGWLGAEHGHQDFARRTNCPPPSKPAHAIGNLSADILCLEANSKQSGTGEMHRHLLHTGARGEEGL